MDFFQISKLRFWLATWKNINKVDTVELRCIFYGIIPINPCIINVTIIHDKIAKFIMLVEVHVLICFSSQNRR